jgi:hypothetical protein
VFSIVRELLQWNVAGIPAYHQVTEWDFDPDVSQKRREQFYEVFVPNFSVFSLFICAKFIVYSSFMVIVVQNISSESDRESMGNIESVNIKML